MGLHRWVNDVSRRPVVNAGLIESEPEFPTWIPVTLLLNSGKMISDDKIKDQPSPTVNTERPSHVSPVAPALTSGPTEPRKLTPEEQMALYENDLKENDWGHQPC
jgi:hypothetical protein